MCGLFGIAKTDQNFSFPESELIHARNALSTLSHRGPDQHGESVSGPVYMGHRRLSILDLSESGRQPMISEDGSIAITVNGEIYNFKSLRRELESAGFAFRSHSDSEVVLHGFCHWGAQELAERMDGMYAAVIHDRRNNTVTIIRDRAGVKPLYYWFDGRDFAWASELKALVFWIGQDRLSPDNAALFDFLTYRYIPAPKTCYRNIYKLPQAHILELRLQSRALSVRPYWNLPVSERSDRDDVLAEELRALLSQSVRDQMMSDVPIGFLLSGGIDSSVVTLTGAKLSARPMTFSIGFADPARDESRFAQIVADQAGTDHHSHILQHEEMENLPARMAAWFDEPFGDTSAVPTHRVCDFARGKVTVALSGDGGDELFGGYKWYELYRKIRTAQKIIPFMPARGIESKDRRLSLLTMRDPVALYAALRGGLYGAALEKWRNRFEIPQDYDRLWAYRSRFMPGLPPRKAAQVMDFHTYLPDDILTKVDRVSMAVALECRPPFLSRDLIEFAYSLPERFIYKNGALKGGLKFAFSGLLPDSILYRDKQGFSVPDFGWRTAMIKQSGSVQEAMIDQFLTQAAA